MAIDLSLSNEEKLSAIRFRHEKNSIYGTSLLKDAFYEYLGVKGGRR